MRNLIALILLLITTSSAAQDSLNVRHLFNWDDPSIPGSDWFNNQYNEVWGHAADGREYAIIGSTLGVHIFDVTDPGASVEVGMVPGQYMGVDVIHRDFKTYAGYLYAVCDEGPSTLQIIDLHYLPDSVVLVYNSNALLTRAHNIQIDTLNARLYTNGGSSQFSIYSLEDPALPVLLSDCEADIPWWGGTIGYVHDCFVRDNIVWCNHEDGMHVIDFTDVNAPAILGSITEYPGQGYNHSGWLNGDGTLYAMADETHGSPLKFIDATDLSDLEVISTVTSSLAPLAIVHNPFFHGDVLHVAYYYDGYWLWDTSDPMQPELMGFYNTSTLPYALNYEGAWGVYPYLPSGNILVSDMQTGLWVLAIENTTGTQEAPIELDFVVKPTITDGPVTVLPVHPSNTPMQIQIMDGSGRMIRAIENGSSQRIELDLGDLQNGIYLITVHSMEGMHTQRIIKTSGR